MKFYFNLSQMAATKQPYAQIRENRIVLMLAMCLKHLGHEVTCSRPPLPFFVLKVGQNIPVQKKPPKDALIVGSESDHGDICYNYRASTYKNRHIFDTYTTVITNEYCPQFESHPSLLPTPFPVSNVIIDYFLEHNLLTDYITDNYQSIREHISELTGDKHTKKIGFIGSNLYERGHTIDVFHSVYPYLDIQFEKANAEEYLKRMSTWRAGLFISGETPKANRWAELALLGVPIICVPLQPRIEPEATTSNTILLRTWDDRETFEELIPRSKDIAQQATQDYLNGWSLLSQARRLCERYS